MEFYSYLWLRQKDQSPYYVGKGHGNRAFTGRSHAVKCPADRARIVIFPQDSEAAAFQSEKDLIALFGRKDQGTGCLRNITDGGEGASGYHHTPETLEKIKRASQGNSYARGKHWHLSPEACANHIPNGQKMGRINGRKNVESGHLAAISPLGGRAAVKSGQLAGICSLGGRRRAMFTNHKRWHASRNKIVPTCPLCVPSSN